VMKDIKLPDFGMPDEFTDLCDIFESHTKKYSSWAKILAKVTDTEPRQVQQFIEHTIRAPAVIQKLSASLIKYWAHAVEIREIYKAPMEHHMFPYAKTYEELFIIWSEYEKNHHFKAIS
jgi:hypothetical protein